MKKVIFSIIATVIIAGSVVYANTTTKSEKSCAKATNSVCCPCTPDCQPGDQDCTCTTGCTCTTPENK